MGIWRSSASMSGVDAAGAMGLIGLIFCLKTSILQAIWNVLIILGGESTTKRYEDNTRAFDGQKKGLLLQHDFGHLRHPDGLGSGHDAQHSTARRIGRWGHCNHEKGHY